MSNTYILDLINNLAPQHQVPLRDQLNDINTMSHRELLALKNAIAKDLIEAHPGTTVAQIAPVINVAVQERLMHLEGRPNTIVSATQGSNTTADDKAFDKLVDNAIENSHQPGMQDLIKQVKDGKAINAQAVTAAKEHKDKLAQGKERVTKAIHDAYGAPPTDGDTVH